MKEAQQSMLRVECHAGYGADEEPRRFFIGKRTISIDAILDRWLEPEHRYFKVRGDDGGVYILHHGLKEDQWDLTLYDSGQREETRLSST